MMMLIGIIGNGALGYQLAFGLSAMFSLGVLVVAVVAVDRTRS